MAVLRGFVRLLRRLAIAGAAGAVAIGIVLAQGGLSTGDWVLLAFLISPAVIVLMFAQGVAEVAALPERVRRVPREGRDRTAELTRLLAVARTARLRTVPFLLWRLRGSVSALRDFAGVALPLRVFTPGFAGLAAFSAFACLVLVCAGVIALLALAA